ncbi:3-methyladenine DNA glycosylase [Propioniciclava sinopodophylli]|uniref:3-methyladenine DNA glycosylase n=1 Tax=Propioniciclava sinopodophylli TaxID=1837344 RepID=A0A4Q9KF31_9ACTN|nr:3-methyladenine DNA glycosylase [Propioniciclava sinopodophylli]TBT86554.1 3-methyladenine DNA glycosylase [Propioniciclava sinopodophylli]
MILAESQWRPLADAHAVAVDALAAAHLERRRRGEKHPVEDFLWTYYSHRPGQLRRWHPGPGVRLEGASERLAWRYHREVDGLVEVDLATYLAERGDTVAFVRRLLAATRERPAQWSCFGLHEWAMVYRTDATRHAWPLRLGAAGTDAVVEDHQLRCTHFDAFRFFTPDAVGRNSLAPTRERQVDLEQPGCLHATMDLYKWSFKLAPGIPTALVMDAFSLAREARELDMRAAPYDLAALGVEPIRVETAEGKATYVTEQRRIAEQGEALRARLVAACDLLLAGADAVRRAG